MTNKEIDNTIDKLRLTGQLKIVLDALIYFQEKRIALQEELYRLKKKDMDKIVKPKLSVMGYNKNDIEPTN
jgi:hypothetical protein